MLSYIERLRKKPLKERRQIAVSVSVIVVVIIGCVWALFNLSHFGVSDKNTTPSENTSGIAGPYEQP